MEAPLLLSVYACINYWQSICQLTSQKSAKVSILSYLHRARLFLLEKAGKTPETVGSGAGLALRFSFPSAPYQGPGRKVESSEGRVITQLLLWPLLLEVKRVKVCILASSTDSPCITSQQIKPRLLRLPISLWNLVSGIWGGKNKYRRLQSSAFDPSNSWRFLARVPYTLTADQPYFVF